MALQMEHNWGILFFCFSEIASISILMKKEQRKNT